MANEINDPPSTLESPTTVRLPSSHLESLRNINAKTGLSRSALIQLAITSFIDYVERTGKIPAPHARKHKKGAPYAS